MKDLEFVVEAKISGSVFRKFAFFDTFVRQGRWKPPALFAGILSVSAMVCLMLRTQKEGAALLGIVLLCVGLGLPVFYVGNFIRSVNRQCRLLDQRKDLVAYTLTLSKGGIGVCGNGQTENHTWSSLYQIYRVRGCIYLYTAQNKAYLLPENENSNAIWSLIEQNTSGEKRAIRC